MQTNSQKSRVTLTYVDEFGNKSSVTMCADIIRAGTIYEWVNQHAIQGLGFIWEATKDE